MGFDQSSGGYSSNALYRAAFTTGSVEGRRRSDEYGCYDTYNCCGLA